MESAYQAIWVWLKHEGGGGRGGEQIGKNHTPRSSGCPSSADEAKEKSV